MSFSNMKFVYFPIITIKHKRIYSIKRKDKYFLRFEFYLEITILYKRERIYKRVTKNSQACNVCY